MKNDLNITVVHCKGNKDHYYVGRPNVLGNPFTHKENTKAEFIVESRNKAVEEYEKYIRNKIKENDKAVLAEFRRLKNEFLTKNELRLGCWCYPAACHGDVLKKILITSLEKTMKLRELNHQKYFFLYLFDFITELKGELIFDSKESIVDLVPRYKTGKVDMYGNELFELDTIEIPFKDGTSIGIGQIVFQEAKNQLLVKIDDKFYPFESIPFEKVIKINSIQKRNTKHMDIENVPVFEFDKVEFLLPTKQDELITGYVIFDNHEETYKIKTNNGLFPINKFLFYNRSNWLNKLA